MKQGSVNYEKLLAELNQFRLSIDNTLRMEVECLKGEVNSRDELNSEMRKQLHDLAAKLNAKADCISEQDKIIKQLRLIHVDLQATNRSEREAHKMLQNENDSLRRMYEEVNAKYGECVACEKRTREENAALRKRCEQHQRLSAQHVKLSEKSCSDTVKAQQYEIEQLRVQCELQGEKLRYKQDECEQMERRIVSLMNEVDVADSRVSF